MQSIQKWGNYRANLYWEAHLKAGHVPPDQYVPLLILSPRTSHQPFSHNHQQNGILHPLKIRVPPLGKRRTPTLRPFSPRRHIHRIISTSRVHTRAPAYRTSYRDVHLIRCCCSTFSLADSDTYDSDNYEAASAASSTAFCYACWSVYSTTSTDCCSSATSATTIDASPRYALL